MIYFDNAATTLMKPPAVADAVYRAINTFGGVGRGVHEASLTAGMSVYSARETLADFFGCASPSCVSFTSNATEALNIAIKGILKPGDHAITTAAAHNSVLRPLYDLEESGVALSILDVDSSGRTNLDALEGLFRPETRLVVCPHASNLTGDLVDIARVAAICHEHDAILLVDVAQTAGLFPLDMRSQGLDIIAFTGHKSLFGPQGTGGLCVAEGITIAPLKVGGSGTHSYDKKHPVAMPESLEAGTLNAHGIAGLLAGVLYLRERGLDTVRAETQRLASRFYEGIRATENLHFYGDFSTSDRSGIVALNIADLDSGIVSDLLSQRYDICIRSGAHCAPLMHGALGTEGQGIVRFSFSHFNTVDEIDEGVRAVREIAAQAG